MCFFQLIPIPLFVTPHSVSIRKQLGSRRFRTALLLWDKSLGEGGEWMGYEKGGVVDRESASPLKRTWGKGLFHFSNFT